MQHDSDRVAEQRGRETTQEAGYAAERAVGMTMDVPVPKVRKYTVEAKKNTQEERAFKHAAKPAEGGQLQTARVKAGKTAELGQRDQ